MSNGNFGKVMQSPFSTMFGFLASLISNNFVEKASSHIFEHDSIDLIIINSGIVLISGFWFFYIIYGTLSWLLFTEYDPGKSGFPPSLPKMLILRFLEFIPFIWLYDIIHIIDPLNDYTRPFSRLSLNIGIVLLIWSIWKMLFTCFTQTNWRTKKILLPTSALVSFSIIFIVLSFGLGHLCNSLNTLISKRPQTPYTIYSCLILSLLTAIFLLVDIYLIHRDFYKTINKILGKITSFERD